MESRTTSEDIFNVVSNFFEEKELSWNPLVIETHCIIHREILASKTMPPEIKTDLNTAIGAVNFIKSRPLNSRLFKLLFRDMNSDPESLLFHFNVWWLSKGIMLKRFFVLLNQTNIFNFVTFKRLHELQKEVIIFLGSKFKSQSFGQQLERTLEELEINCETVQIIRTKNLDGS